MTINGFFIMEVKATNERFANEVRGEEKGNRVELGPHVKSSLFHRRMEVSLLP